MTAEIVKFNKWATYYVENRKWKLTPVHIIVNETACSCVKGEACPSAGKHPKLSHWEDPARAIQTKAQVDDTWKGEEGSPYSIGILGGQASGVVIIDIDPRNGGNESLAKLVDEYPFPDTLTALTGGGGKHYFYSIPKGLLIKKGPLNEVMYPGIDIVAERSQSLLPPSVHKSGGRYEWATSPTEPIAELPEHLIGLLLAPRRGVVKVSADGVVTGGTGLPFDPTARVPHGTRNNEAVRCCTYYSRMHGLDKDSSRLADVVALVRIWNEDMCIPPLPEEELVGIMERQIEFIRANPSTAPAPKPLTNEQVEWVKDQEEKKVLAQANKASNVVSLFPAAQDDSSIVDEESAPQTSSGSDGSQGSGDRTPPPVVPTSGGPPLPSDPDDINSDPLERTMSDLGNARRFVDMGLGEVRHVEERGWCTFKDNRWSFKGAEAFVYERMKFLPSLISSQALLMPSQTMADDMMEWAQSTRNRTRMEAALKLSETDSRIHSQIEDWDRDEHLLGVLNGVVNLKTGELLPMSSDYLISRWVEINYDPTARSKPWDNFLHETTKGDVEFQEWLQRAMGYTITGSIKEEKFFLVYGPAGTGKTTLVETVGNVLGDYRLSMNADFITGQANSKDEYYYASLPGKRMIVVSELQEAQHLKEASTKRITGGDSISAREPGGKPFNFMSQGKLWIATNYRPKVSEDGGIWRRMIAIPFLNKSENPDRDLKNTLTKTDKGEEAVLAWSVAGAVAWYAKGLGDCAVVRDSTAAYKASEDRMGQFLLEETSNFMDSSVPIFEVFARWKMWCEEREEKSGSVTTLLSTLRDRGLSVEGNGRSAVINEIKMKPVHSMQLAPAAGYSGPTFAPSARTPPKF